MIKLCLGVASLTQSQAPSNRQQEFREAPWSVHLLMLGYSAVRPGEHDELLEYVHACIVTAAIRTPFTCMNHYHGTCMNNACFLQPVQQCRQMLRYLLTLQLISLHVVLHHIIRTKTYRVLGNKKLVSNRSTCKLCKVVAKECCRLAYIPDWWK